MRNKPTRSGSEQPRVASADGYSEMKRLVQLLPFAVVVACGSGKPAEEPPGTFSADTSHRIVQVTAATSDAGVAPPAPPLPASLLDALGLELMIPPASSARVMEKVAGSRRRPAPPATIRLDDLLSDALNGGDDMLRDDWTWDHRKAPPAAFVFPAENKQFDVVRFAYSHGDTKVAVAQTTNLIAFRFHDLPIDHTLPVERQAEAAANLVFRPPTKRPLPFAFSPGKRAGEAFTAVRVAPPQQWPTWHEVMTFWTDGTDVGFVTLKADGFISQNVPSADAESNAHWFARYPKRQGAKK